VSGKMLLALYGNSMVRLWNLLDGRCTFKYLLEAAIKKEEEDKEESSSNEDEEDKDDDDESESDENPT